MIGKHLLLSLRNLRKNLLYSVLVCSGLALGTATLITSIQWSAWHMSYDRDVPGKENIYRLTFEELNEDFYRHTARIIHGNALQRIMFTDMLGELERKCRLAPFRKAILIIEEQEYYEEFAFSADPDFMEIFKPPVISGDRENLLSEPHTVVLTESAARKYFGKENPVGHSIELMHQFDVKPHSYTVKAVIRDFPPNSHMKLSLLTSFENPVEYEGTGWTYVKLKEGSLPDDVERSMKIFLLNSIPENYISMIEPRLQALKDIHLKSHKARELQPNLRYRTVMILLIAGILVFILAWFNFTLLSFSQNRLQAQRLVIQWQMGAGKRVFLLQFLIDNLLVGMISFLAGTLLTFLVFPELENLEGFGAKNNTSILAFSLAAIFILISTGSVLTALFSTERLYAYLQRKFLSSNSGQTPPDSGKNIFIRAVIVLEFIITFILVSNLLMIGRQTQFAMSSQLGAAQKESIHIHSLHRPVIDKYSIFKERMLENPEIALVTGSMEEPTGQCMDANTFEIDGVDEGDKQLFLFPVDENFIHFYDLEVMFGEAMPAFYNPDDSIEYFYLNETAARMITDDPSSLIGRELELNFPYPGLIWPGPIRGIVNDFHLSGLDYEITPMVIFPKYTWLYCFSIQAENETETGLLHLKEVWSELFPDYPLEYYHASEMIETLYKSELVQFRILLIYCILSIIIAGFGLFALSGLFMQKRSKAAALRKINGARMIQLILPEYLNYLWLVLLSSLLSIAPALLLMERWLRNFKYRADFPFWVFPACFIILLLFSWMAVLYHSIRLARINPLKFIRDQ